MERVFKIRASAASKILGRMGLSDAQLEKMNMLIKRSKDATLPRPTQKPLTAIMKKELDELVAKHQDQSFQSLPQTTKTYLMEWYANDEDEVYTKQMLKGEWVEDEVIDMAADKLKLGALIKNEQSASDEFFQGCCDAVAPELILEVKAPWNRKNLLDRVLAGNDWEHEIQLIVYCHLYKKPKGILFYGLVDTPSDCNFGKDVYFTEPSDERWVAYEVKANDDIIKALVGRVMLCRQWLEWYDQQIKSKLGKAI